MQSAGIIYKCQVEGHPENGSPSFSAILFVMMYSPAPLSLSGNPPPRRTPAEAMVMNPPEPVKEKEKQGFFRAMKKKKKKTQMVRVC